jgi:orotate phosphoribosyltransferase
VQELAAAIREAALLEGDFVLRSGKRSSWYLDKYRFETRPDLLRALGARLAEVADEPDGPARSPGARPSSCGRGIARLRPAVRDRPQQAEANTAPATGSRACSNRERVCLVEDVVTAGGAALEAVVACAKQDFVVPDRRASSIARRGGADALARAAVRLRPLLPLLGGARGRSDPAWLSDIRSGC